MSRDAYVVGNNAILCLRFIPVATIVGSPSAREAKVQGFPKNIIPLNLPPVFKKPCFQEVTVLLLDLDGSI